MSHLRYLPRHAVHQVLLALFVLGGFASVPTTAAAGSPQIRVYSHFGCSYATADPRETGGRSSGGGCARLPTPVDANGFPTSNHASTVILQNAGTAPWTIEILLTLRGDVRPGNATHGPALWCFTERREIDVTATSTSTAPDGTTSLRLRTTKQLKPGGYLSCSFPFQKRNASSGGITAPAFSFGLTMLVPAGILSISKAGTWYTPPPPAWPAHLSQRVGCQVQVGTATRDVRCAAVPVTQYPQGGTITNRTVEITLKHTAGAIWFAPTVAFAVRGAILVTAATCTLTGERTSPTRIISVPLANTAWSDERVQPVELRFALSGGFVAPEDRVVCHFSVRPAQNPDDDPYEPTKTWQITSTAASTTGQPIADTPTMTVNGAWQ